MPEASVAATICTFIARSKECQSKVQTCLGRDCHRNLPHAPIRSGDPGSSGARGESAGSAAAVAALVGSFKVEEASMTHHRIRNFSGEEGCFPSTGDQVIVAAQKFCWPVILGAAGLFGPLSSTNPDGLLTHTPTSSHLWSPGVGDSPV